MPEALGRVYPGWLRTVAAVRFPAMAAVFNLNHHASYLHWHFFEMSVGNVLVIVLMVIVFTAAVLAPFPGRRTRGSA